MNALQVVVTKVQLGLVCQGSNLTTVTLHVLRDLGGGFEAHIACMPENLGNVDSRIEGLGLLDQFSFYEHEFVADTETGLSESWENCGCQRLWGWQK